MKPYYLMVAFWGERYREAFYSLCLSSLLSPNNIPSLAARRRSKFVLCTTVEDWSALQARPLFEKLREYMEPAFIDIGYPAENVHPHIHMSKGHRLAAQKAIEERARAGFVAPDMLVSDGMVRFVLEKAEQGKCAVLTPALRYGLEPVVEALQRDGRLVRDRALTLQPRYLAGIGQRALHSEILRYEFEAPCFGENPIWSWWRLPQDEGLVIHTVSWALLLGDFGNLPQHRDRRLYDSTIDGFYVYENFFRQYPSDDLYLSTDSDEVVFMGLTPESELTFRLEERPINRSRWGFHNRLCEMHRFLHGGQIDDFRRLAYRKPFRLHGRPLSPEGERVAKRSSEIVAQAFSLPLHERLTQVVFWWLVRNPVTGKGNEALLAVPPTTLGIARYLACSGMAIVSYRWRNFERRVLRWSFGWLVRPLFSRCSREMLVGTVGLLPWRYRRAVMRRLKSRDKPPAATGATGAAAGRQRAQGPVQ